MDPAAVRIRFWTRVLSMPIAWLPAVSGVCLTLSGYSSWFAIAGPALSAVAVGAILLTRRDAIWQQSADDIRAEEQYLEQAKLRDLRRRLRQDKEYRSNQLIRDLQDLYDRMRHNQLVEFHEDDSQVVHDIKQQTWDLYEAGYESLERTYELWKASDQMSKGENRERLQEMRKHLLDEVRESLSYLGQGVDFLQSHRLNAVSNESLTESGKELARGLEVAREIQRRLDELEQEIKVTE